MHEGRKHEIRNIGAALGLPVLRLIRVRLGALALGDLRPGEWRELKGWEVKRLRENIEPHRAQRTRKKKAERPSRALRPVR
jgi:16S rRNA U516 pseudouridylate synthase RsuA-like enzyme